MRRVVDISVSRLAAIAAAASDSAAQTSRALGLTQAGADAGGMYLENRDGLRADVGSHGKIRKVPKSILEEAASNDHVEKLRTQVAGDAAAQCHPSKKASS